MMSHDTDFHRSGYSGSHPRGYGHDDRYQEAQRWEQRPTGRGNEQRNTRTAREYDPGLNSDSYDDPTDRGNKQRNTRSAREHDPGLSSYSYDNSTGRGNGQRNTRSAREYGPGLTSYSYENSTGRGNEQRNTRSAREYDPGLKSYSYDNQAVPPRGYGQDNRGYDRADDDYERYEPVRTISNYDRTPDNAAYANQGRPYNRDHDDYRRYDYGENPQRSQILQRDPDQSTDDRVIGRRTLTLPEMNTSFNHVNNPDDDNESHLTRSPGIENLAAVAEGGAPAPESASRAVTEERREPVPSTSNSFYPEVLFKPALGMGIAQIVLGVLIFVFGIVEVTLYGGLLEPPENTAAQGIWGGMVIIAAGILSVLSAVKRTKLLIYIALSLTFGGIVVDCILFGLCGSMIGSLNTVVDEGWWNFYSVINGQPNFNYWYAVYDLLVIFAFIHIVIAIITLLAHALSFIPSKYFRRRRKKPPPQVRVTRRYQANGSTATTTNTSRATPSDQSRRIDVVESRNVYVDMPRGRPQHPPSYELSSSNLDYQPPRYDEALASPDPYDTATGYSISFPQYSGPAYGGEGHI